MSETGARAPRARTKRPRTVPEKAAVMRCARVAKAVQVVQTAAGQTQVAREALDMARAEAVLAIVDLAPQLTPEQREQLRPLLSGTLPADAARADTAAA